MGTTIQDSGMRERNDNTYSELSDTIGLSFEIL